MEGDLVSQTFEEADTNVPTLHFKEGTLETITEFQEISEGRPP